MVGPHKKERPEGRSLCRHYFAGRGTLPSYHTVEGNSVLKNLPLALAARPSEGLLLAVPVL